ncbi:MAG TPA: dTDP-4-dehydrorhamnose reductase [Saprospiraceae bacterium]|nr:dTDP-4-dehydrorhamnose reductase [Saprospiraceae bacterium]
METINIVITGAQGQLGQELQFLSGNYPPQWKFVFLSRKECDITDKRQISKMFEHYKPDYLINAAAYTLVDKAETDQEQAFAVNAYAMHNLVRHSHLTKIIHISSDYIYHPVQYQQPIPEDLFPQPRNVYARSKWEGEKVLFSSDSSFIILRTSWLYSVFGHNFVKTILKKLKAGEELRVVDDQTGSPTNARDLAKVILQIISEDKEGSYPVSVWCKAYNYANEGATTWYGLALKIAALKGIKSNIQPIPTALYPTPAERPPWSVMDLKKFTNTFSINVPHWEVSLNEALSEIVN